MKAECWWLNRCFDCKGVGHKGSACPMKCRSKGGDGGKNRGANGVEVNGGVGAGGDDEIPMMTVPIEIDTKSVESIGRTCTSGRNLHRHLRATQSPSLCS